MKKRIIYLLIAVIGTVGFNSCGPTQGTNDTNQNDTMGTGTETTTGTTGTTTGTTGDRTGTTGTTGTTTGTTGDRTGTTGTTTGTTGDRTGTTGTTTGTTGDRTGTTGDVTSGSTDNYGTGNMQDQNNFELTEATDYTYGTDNFRFTPDNDGINITRNQDGQESPFGTMRSIGNEGYFMLTTTSDTGEEEVAVGKFDEQGHFTLYKYDRDTDDISEETYRSGNTQNNNMNQNQGGSIDPTNNNN